MESPLIAGVHVLHSRRETRIEPSIRFWAKQTVFYIYIYIYIYDTFVKLFLFRCIIHVYTDEIFILHQQELFAIHANAEL